MDNTSRSARTTAKAGRDFIPPANVEQVTAELASAPGKMLPFGFLEVSSESHDLVVFVFYFQGYALKYPIADLMMFKDVVAMIDNYLEVLESEAD